MYGRKYMGVERTTAIVDPDGRIARAVAQGESARPRRRGAGGARGGADRICQPLTLIGCNRSPDDPDPPGSECVGACRCEIQRSRRPRSRSHVLLFSTLAATPFARSRCVRSSCGRYAAFAALTLVWAGRRRSTSFFTTTCSPRSPRARREQQYAYEDRIAEARAELDRVAGRQLLDQSSFEGKLHELLSRQARLEQRGAIVAALADQTTRSLAAAEPPAHASSVAAAKPAGSALSAIGAASPLAATDSVIGPAAQRLRAGRADRRGGPAEAAAARRTAPATDPRGRRPPQSAASAPTSSPPPTIPTSAPRRG